MVGSTLFSQIHRRMEELKGTNSFESMFGNVTIIAVGDSYQLPPAGGSFVFELPKDPYARLAKPLWNSVKLAELKIAMRQKGDTQFTEILN